MRAAEHTPRGPFDFLERRDGLAEIVECSRAVVLCKAPSRKVSFERESGPRAAAAAPRSSRARFDLCP